MNTTFSNNKGSFSTKEITKAKTASTFWEQAEFHRFGIIAATLVIIACMGGFAAAIALKGSIVTLTAVAISTGLAEGLILAVAPMRYIALASAVSFLISLFVILF